MTTNCDSTRLDLGAYALGTLEPADQDRLEAHLASCPVCLAELADLESVVPALATLTAADLAPPAPSADLFSRITAAVDATHPVPAPPGAPVAPAVPAAPAVADDDRSATVIHPPFGSDRTRRRRPTRLLLAVAASVVVLAGGGTAVGIALTSSSPAAVTVASGSSGAIRLQVSASDQGSGTRLELTALGLPQNERCHLVALAADGSRHDAGTWNASYEGQAEVTESTDVSRADIRQLQLFDDDDNQLVTVTL